MGLETGTYISDLNANNPVNATDVVGEGDDHLRLIKSTLLNTFPNVTGEVSLTHEQINQAARRNVENTFSLAQTFSAVAYLNAGFRPTSLASDLNAGPAAEGVASIVPSSFQATNRIPGSNYSAALQMNHGVGNFATQIGVHAWNNSDEVWTRGKSNGVWSNWRRLAFVDEAVTLTGAQTIAGTKTFSDPMLLDDGVDGRITFETGASENNLYSSTSGFASWAPLKLNASQLIFASSGSIERMRINSDGNVCIGSTNAWAKLNIDGAGANRVAFGGPTGALYVGYDGATNALQVASNSAITFQSGPGYNERMRITSDGGCEFLTQYGLQHYNAAAGADSKRWSWDLGSTSLSLLAVNDAFNNASPAILFERSGFSISQVSLYSSGAQQFFTQNNAASGKTTGAQVRHADNGYYDVGLNVMPQVVTSASSLTFDRSHVGVALLFNGSTSTWTTPASSDTSMPLGSVITLINLGSGNITIAAGSGSSIERYDGAGSPDSGSRTLAPGGVATLWRRSANVFCLWGNGGLN